MIVRNVLSNWVGLVVFGVVSFILTPILIHGLGDLYYGMWILVSSVFDYCGLLDIGMRTTIQRYVARLRGANERENLAETFTTALVLTLWISVLILVLTIALMWVLPSYFKLHGASVVVFRWLAILMGLNVAITLPSRLLGTYLCGLQRFDLYNLSEILFAIVRAALFVLALYLGYGVLTIAAITLGVTALSAPFLLWLISREDPSLEVRWQRASWAHLRELLVFSFYIFFITIGIRLQSYTDAIVIARMLAVAWVTPFSVAGRLVEFFRQGMIGVSGPLMPALSELEGKRRSGEARALFLRSTRMTASLSIFISAMLLLNGKELLRFWVGEKYVSSYAVLATLTVGYLASLAQAPTGVLLIAQGKHKPLAWLSVGEGLANLVLSIYWAHRYRLVGVALGTTVPMLVSALYILPRYVLHVTGISLREYFRSALVRPIAIGSVFAASCLLISRLYSQLTLFRFLGLITVETATFVLLAYWLVFLPSERQEIWRGGKRFAIVLRAAILDERFR